MLYLEQYSLWIIEIIVLEYLNTAKRMALWLDNNVETDQLIRLLKNKHFFHVRIKTVIAQILISKKLLTIVIILAINISVQALIQIIICIG